MLLYDLPILQLHNSVTLSPCEDVCYHKFDSTGVVSQLCQRPHYLVFVMSKRAVDLYRTQDGVDEAKLNIALTCEHQVKARIWPSLNVCASDTSSQILVHVSHLPPPPAAPVACELVPVVRSDPSVKDSNWVKVRKSRLCMWFSGRHTDTPASGYSRRCERAASGGVRRTRSGGIQQ
jgi:hypothetical protein